MSTAALGVAMNERGDVVGEASTAPPCTGCPPGSEAVVWRKGGARIVLPSLPGRPTIEVRGINASRLVAGSASDSGVDARAVVGETDRRGSVRFEHDGPACVGAVAFLVDGAAARGRTFDRTRGILTNWVISLP